MTIDAGVAVPKHARREVLAQSDSMFHGVIEDEATARLLIDIVKHGKRPVNADVEYSQPYGSMTPFDIDTIQVKWSIPVITNLGKPDGSSFGGNARQQQARRSSSSQWASFFAQRQGWFR